MIQIIQQMESNKLSKANIIKNIADFIFKSQVIYTYCKYGEITGEITSYDLIKKVNDLWQTLGQKVI